MKCGRYGNKKPLQGCSSCMLPIANQLDFCLIQSQAKLICRRLASLSKTPFKRNGYDFVLRGKSRAVSVFPKNLGERGSTYILVIVVMITLFSISASLLLVTNHRLNTTNRYEKNQNGYEAAVAGVLFGLDQINGQLAATRRYWEEKALEDLQAQPPMEAALFQPGSGPFDGQYRLKDSYGMEAVFSTVRESIPVNHVLTVPPYTVNITLLADFDQSFRITAVAHNKETGVTDRAEGLASPIAQGETIFLEGYPLESASLPEPYTQALTVDGAIFGSAPVGGDPPVTGGSTWLDWDGLATLTGTASMLFAEGEISLNGKGQDPSAPVVLLNPKESALVITGGGPFHGLILSRGDIHIRGPLKVSGCVYTAGDLHTAEGFTAVYENHLPLLTYPHQAYMRGFLHYLGIIRFPSETFSIRTLISGPPAYELTALYKKD